MQSVASHISISTELLDQFEQAINGFPPSSDEATVQYDTGKLIDILREKEVIGVQDYQRRVRRCQPN